MTSDEIAELRADEAPRVVVRRTGSEPFTFHADAQGATLNSFWSWAASDLLSNTLRGQLAEFIVGLALDCVDVRLRREWDAFDLKTDDGITVEVKSTAYLQSWGTTRSDSRRFDISESTAWHADTNTSATSASRPADVYVFCVHTAENRNVADPLRLDQWDFYVVSTTRINLILGQQKSIALSVLPKALDTSPVAFGEVADAVRRAARS
ncbi:hypothetical protein [Gordonia sp. NPDC003950]